MKKNIVIAAAACVALAAFCLITWAFMPYTEDYHTVPPMTQKNCGCTSAPVAGTSTTIAPIGEITANGSITAKWLTISPPNAPRAFASIEVVAFNSEQDNDVLGHITWSVDPNRRMISTITANQDGAAYPATATIQFHGLVTVGCIDYITITPVVMQATINSWPNNNTLYTQVGTTDLERVGGKAGVAVLTLKNLNVNVTQL